MNGQSEEPGARHDRLRIETLLWVVAVLCVVPLLNACSRCPPSGLMKSGPRLAITRLRPTTEHVVQWHPTTPSWEFGMPANRASARS